MGVSDGLSVAERVSHAIEAYLGPNNARNAVKTFSLRSLKKKPEELTVEDLPALLAALRPMLRTLLGEESAMTLLDAIRHEVIR